MWSTEDSIAHRFAQSHKLNAVYLHLLVNCLTLLHLKKINNKTLCTLDFLI